jgi:hypothetical protein
MFKKTLQHFFESWLTELSSQAVPGTTIATVLIAVAIAYLAETISEYLSEQNSL